MLKHIKFAIIFLLLTLPLFFWGIIEYNKKVFNLSRGNYFFEETRNSANISHIILSFSNGKKISFSKFDKLWRVKEADDYYVDFSKINLLIDLIRNTVIYRTDAIKENEDISLFSDYIQIITYDNNKNIVDNAKIAIRMKNNKYHYAILNNNNFLYQLSTKIDLSSNVIDWVQMPFLKLSIYDIKKIEDNTFTVSRRFKNTEFKDEKNGEEKLQIYQLLYELTALSAENIYHATHFNRESYKPIRTYSVTTFDGIIYKISLYGNNKDYFINVNLDNEKITSGEASLKISENALLYDGWFFKIDNNVGSILDKFIL